MEKTENTVEEPSTDNFLVTFTDCKQIFKVPRKIAEFSTLLANHEESIGQTLCFSSQNMDVSSFRLIICLLETHNFDKSNFRFQKPLRSVNLQDCIDEQSYLLLKDVGHDTTAMLNLLNACDYLDIQLIKNLVYCCIMTAGKMFLSPTSLSDVYFGADKPSQNKTRIKECFRSFFEALSAMLADKTKARKANIEGEAKFRM